MFIPDGGVIVPANGLAIVDGARFCYQRTAAWSYGRSYDYSGEPSYAAVLKRSP
jgi:hypothetical protein